MSKTKFVSIEEAVELIKPNTSIGVGGGFGAPDSILKGIQKTRKYRNPNKLTIVTPASAGDETEDGWGLAALRGEGLIDSIYTSVLTLPKSIQNLVSQNKIAAYMLPLGVFGFIFRSMAGNEPGVLTHVGLNTYCDPREEGCLINDKAEQSGKEVVRLLNIDGKDYLLYNNIPNGYVYHSGNIC